MITVGRGEREGRSNGERREGRGGFMQEAVGERVGGTQD